MAHSESEGKGTLHRRNGSERVPCLTIPGIGMNVDLNAVMYSDIDLNCTVLQPKCIGLVTILMLCHSIWGNPISMHQCLASLGIGSESHLVHLRIWPL